MTTSTGDEPTPAIPTALFEPFSHAVLTLRNRIVMSPMTRFGSTNGVPQEATIDYYRRRAAGGAGLIVTEGAALDHPASIYHRRIPAMHGDAVPVWKHVVEAVHAEGARVFAQLWHPGLARETENCDDPSPSLGPTAKLPGGRSGRAMNEKDIAETIAAYGRAARAAMEAGFDGVEIHGAHGYLIDEFFWEATNDRTDTYGGDLVQRIRFATEVISEIRTQTSLTFPLMFRFSQWKVVDYGARLASTPQELARLLEPLVDAGIDMFHASTRRFWLPEFEGNAMNLAGWTKHLTGKPVVTVGSVTLTNPRRETEKSAEIAPSVSLQYLDRLNAMIESGEVDLVAVGRAIITNPDWADLVRHGQFEKLKPFHPDQLTELH